MPIFEEPLGMENLDLSEAEYWQPGNILPTRDSDRI